MATASRSCSRSSASGAGSRERAARDLPDLRALPMLRAAYPHRSGAHAADVPVAGRELDGTEVQCEARVFCLDCALIECDL